MFRNYECLHSSGQMEDGVFGCHCVGEKFSDVNVVDQVAHDGKEVLVSRPIMLRGSHGCLGCSSIYNSVFQVLSKSSNFTQPLKRSGQTM